MREATDSERVNLDKNFRSTKAVIDCVNNIFSALMTGSTTGKDYALHPMEYGGLYDKTKGRACIVCCGKRQKETGELPEGVYSIKNHLAVLNNTSVDKEAVAVRKIIDKVYGEEYVVTGADGAEVKKKVGYGDIAVLTRTGYGVDSVAKELISCGIPVVSDSKRSIGEYPEIKMIVAVLKAVNYSGKEDFSLATALKSPVCGLDEAKLLAIRSAFKTGTFYSAVTEYRFGRIDDISIKLNEFFDYLETLKLLSRFCSVADLIKKIVKDKKIDTYFLTERLGEIKLKRLERFIIAAEGFGSGLNLATFIENEASVLKKLTIAFADGDNAVKVMDMHKSKGLEFPVTIVCELCKEIYSHDERDEITYSRKFGIGVKFYDAATGTVYPNVVKRYIDENKKRSTFTEEIRLFYVALTRAKYALYIVTKTEPITERSGNEAETARRLSDLLCRSDCEYVDISKDEDIGKAEEIARPVVIPETPSDADVATIKKYADFVYPYADDVSLSVKRTVTEITKTSAPVDDGETTYAPPIFATASIESGNAYHKFLQLCSLDGEKADEDLAALKTSGALTDEEYALLNAEQLKKILSSDVFKKLSGYKFYREQPFIAYVPAALAGEKGGAEVLVQGVIDLLAVNGDTAVIVDYKYSGRSGEQLAAAYGKQLELYAFAVEKVLSLKVVSKILLNIKTCEETQLI